MNHNDMASEMLRKGIAAVHDATRKKDLSARRDSQTYHPQHHFSGLK